MFGAGVAAVMVLAQGAAGAWTPTQASKAAVAGVIVGDLRNAYERKAFDERARSKCGAPIPVRIERIANAAPSDTVIDQRPAAGSFVPCFRDVTLVYSLGTESKPPPVWRMPRLDSPDDEARLANDHGENCATRPLRIERIERYDSRPPGALILQTPYADTPFACDSRVRVTRSLGPKPITVGRLDTPGRRAGFESQASQFCRTSYSVKLIERPASQPPGTYMEQNQPPGTVFSCEMAVNVTIASEPLAWQMPPLPGRLDEQRLDYIHRQRCDGQPLAITRLQEDRASTAGTLISQEPRPGTAIACGISVETLRSRGPKPSFTIGPLDTPQRRSEFETKAGAYCDRSYSIRIDKQSDALPTGSFLNQSRPRDTIFACGMDVAVTLASPRPDGPPPPAWLMPDMALAAAETTLNSTAIAQCGHALPITRVPDVRTADLIEQEPQPGKRIGCTTSIKLTYAKDKGTTSGEAGTGIVPPPPTPPLEVGKFTDFGRGAVDKWISDATRICGGPPAVTISTAASARPAGTVIDQTVPPDTRIACATPIGFTIAEPANIPVWVWAVAAVGVISLGFAVWGLWPDPIPPPPVTPPPVPLPRIVFGEPKAGGLPPEQSIGGVLPVIAVEASRGGVSVAVPALPVLSEEVDDG